MRKTQSKEISFIKSKIRVVQDFPTKGVGLKNLGGSEKLKKYPIYSLIQYD